MMRSLFAQPGFVLVALAALALITSPAGLPYADAAASPVPVRSFCGIVGSRLVAPLGPGSGASAGTIVFTLAHGHDVRDRIVVSFRRSQDDLVLEYTPMDTGILESITSVTCTYRDSSDTADVRLAASNCGMKFAPTVMDSGFVATIISAEIAKDGLHVLYRAQREDLGGILIGTFTRARFFVSVDGVRREQALSGRAPQVAQIFFPRIPAIPRQITAGMIAKQDIITSRLCLH
jgi:hypothetical protein